MSIHDPDCLGHSHTVDEMMLDSASEEPTLSHDDEAGDDKQRGGLVKRTMLGAIGLYRMTASVRTPRCRYIPSCSAYAAEAIEVHGPGRSLWLAIRRLGRCHPFGSFGFDPVPDKKPEKQ